MSLFTASVLAIFIAGWVFAHRRGGPPERLAGAILLGWMVTDISYHVVFGRSDFNSVDPMHLVFDGGLLVAITWVALRANRMWPLWAAAASLVCMSGHLAILIHPVGMRRAYWALTQLPQYIQLIALLLGTHAHVRRLKKLGQPYRSWRKAAM
jgi:hypothetical protein